MVGQTDSQMDRKGERRKGAEREGSNIHVDLHTESNCNGGKAIPAWTNKPPSAISVFLYFVFTWY